MAYLYYTCVGAEVGDPVALEDSRAQNLVKVTVGMSSRFSSSFQYLLPILDGISASIARAPTMVAVPHT